MDVILCINSFPSLTKSQINEGKIPSDIIEIADFLRNTFLLSNSLIQQNNLIIYCSNQFLVFPASLIIFFNGFHLRYLAPDERGILFLLLKVHKIISGQGGKKQERKEHKKFLNNAKAQSTPGIYLKRGTLSDTWELHPSLGKDYILIGNTRNQYLEQISLNNLDDAIHPDIVLVFNHCSDFDFSPPSQTSLSVLERNSWKSMFFESELISLIQSKIHK